MKLKFLNVAVTAGLMSVSAFTHLAYADLVSTADCQAANTATPGSCLTIADWHETSDDFGGVKKAAFADDLFLVVSKSGIYNKAGNYEIIPGYHWATQAEWIERFDPYKEANGTGDISEYNYYNLGGWFKYEFNDVQRRDFLYADSSITAKTVYAGHREKDSIRTDTMSHSTHPEYAASDPATTVALWAGFVLIKDAEVVEQNVAPRVNLSVEQNGKLTSVIDAQSGVVTVTAAINDVNQLDSHTVTWDVGSSPLLDLNNDNVDSTFEFNASLLDAGTYELTVYVAEDNTAESFAVSVDVNLVVEASLAALGADTDADNDGIFDAVEGYGDSDQDGIADYLDDDSDTSLLPIGVDQPMQTVSGLQLSLGDTVRSSNGSASADASINYDDIATNGGDNGSAVDNAIDADFQAISTIVNFNISGLSALGDSAAVVIPLANGESIPENSVYRKYKEATGWFNFVEDVNNSIKSALKDGSGLCPAPLATEYVDGLIVGNDCIQLIIEDGGANDADDLANAVVKDPGVLALAKNIEPNIVVGNAFTVSEESAVSIDASATTDAENEVLTYSWTQLSGTSVTLVGENSAVLSFTTPSIVSDETLTFQLMVTDGTNSPTANVDVLVTHVNDAPTVTIDAHEASIDEALLVSFTAQGGDINGDDISYQWEQVSGPSITIANPTAAKISFLAPLVAADTTMEFKVTASDGTESVSVTTSLMVNNRTPKNSSGGSMGWMLALIAFGAFRRKSFNVKS